jgi:hypothetical protein
MQMADELTSLGFGLEGAERRPLLPWLADAAPAALRPLLLVVECAGKPSEQGGRSRSQGHEGQGSIVVQLGNYRGPLVTRCW